MLKPVLSPKPPTAHPEQGLTLIECLVAIVMVALVAGSIAPVMVISVASRVNNQKAEQALGLAQAEIDRTRNLVQRGVEPGGATITLASLPAVATGIAEGDIETTPGITASAARPVDIDEDGTPDFLVHTFRTAGFPTSATIPSAFSMGVRVYDIRALETSGTLLTEPASLALTGGEGDRRTSPLAALYTTIAVGDDPDSLCNMIDFLNSQEGGTPMALPPSCTP